MHACIHTYLPTYIHTLFFFFFPAAVNEEVQGRARETTSTKESIAEDCPSCV
jgi:hypothetical protein